MSGEAGAGPGAGGADLARPGGRTGAGAPPHGRGAGMAATPAGRGPARRKIPRAFGAACAAAALALGGCLFDQPLVRPEDTYDARAALRGDSLARFDTVEVWLEDADDSAVIVRLWKGPLASADSLGIGVAGGGRHAVFVVRGYRRDRGYCFAERKARDGATLEFQDTCASPPPPPRFQSRTLDLADSLPATIGIDDMPDYPISATTQEKWLSVQWERYGDKDSGETGLLPALRVSGRSWYLPVGKDSGYIVLDSAGKALDSLRVRLTVPQRFVRGRAVDWNTGGPLAGIRVDLGKEYGAVTDSAGNYAIPVQEALPAAYVARFSGPGRIGKQDTLRLAPGPEPRFTTALPPALPFQAIDLGALRPLGALAAAAGYGILLSTPPDQPGCAFLVRLDARPPVLEKTIPLANSDGDPDLAGYYEAGGMVADSDALYIAYPDENRIGRIGAWRASPDAKIVSVPLQPGGLLRDGEKLLTLGRLSDGTLALARFRASDLALLGVDTLAGYAWDGVLPLQRSPQLVSGPGAYFAVDGNAPNVRGRVLRLGKEDGKVMAERELPEGEVVDLAWAGGILYAAGADPRARLLRGFDADLRPVDSIALGGPVARVAGDPGGRFGEYGFALTADGLSVFAPGSGEPLGRIDLPGGARRLALDPPTRSVLVSDGSRLFYASF